jgi:hypothetical protein
MGQPFCFTGVYLMNRKYYGSVSSNKTGTLFEGLYDSKAEGIKELNRKGRRAAHKDDYTYNTVSLNLFCGERLVAYGKIRSGSRPSWNYHPAREDHDLNALPLSGVKIC